MAILAHEHDFDGEIPDRLPAEELRALSQLDAGRAVRAIAAEWALIAAALVAGHWLRGTPAFWPLYPLLVLFIGARQHALAVLGHDAVHWRLLPSRRANDILADLLLWWPVLGMNEGFRRYHGTHHRHLGTDLDGNIELWRLRRADGRPTAEWTYPKSWVGLTAKLLWRGCGLTGAARMAFSLFNTFRIHSFGYAAARFTYYGVIVAAVAVLDAWSDLLLLWLVPLATWFIASNYVRLICEHTCVRSDEPAYAQSRTTIPSRFDRWFVVPRNISYHYEHHAWPAVPFYRLPELHERLMHTETFRRHAHVTRGVWRALAECVGRRAG
jgi:fatty acid desaturase